MPFQNAAVLFAAFSELQFFEGRQRKSTCEVESDPFEWPYRIWVGVLHTTKLLLPLLLLYTQATSLPMNFETCARRLVKIIWGKIKFARAPPRACKFNFFCPPPMI